MRRAPQRLAAALDCSFRDSALLVEALTHRSAGAVNSERLEFLGDAILGFIIAERLYDATNTSEGDMSRLRATLVRRETLAEIALEWGFGDYLQLGTGELKSGGHRRKSILADAVEALIGAVYKDRGIEAASAVIKKLYGDRLEALDQLRVEKDPKSRLQEYLQSRGMPLPEYEVVTEQGPPHAREFVVRCAVAVAEIACDGHGSSLRSAEQAAAEAAYEAFHRE